MVLLSAETPETREQKNDEMSSVKNRGPEDVLQGTVRKGNVSIAARHAEEKTEG